jgi:hypothetical protein
MMTASDSESMPGGMSRMDYFEMLRQMEVSEGMSDNMLADALLLDVYLKFESATRESALLGEVIRRLRSWAKREPRGI